MTATKDRLAASTEEVKRTIEIVWSAYRSVLSKEGRLAYVSTAITSGERMYEVLDKLGLADAEELKAKAPKALLDEVVKPNLESGTAHARRLASAIDHPVVAPTLFEGRPQRWGQDEYMALWLRLIEENVGRIYMAPGWEWSNGGVEEFLQAVQMRLGFKSRHDIEILDHEGRPITFHVGLAAVGAALRKLHERRRKAPVVADAFQGLVAAWGLWHQPELGRDELPENYDRTFLGSGDVAVIGDVKRELAPLLKGEYGIELERWQANTGTGVARANDATPEGVILKAEEPGEGAK